MARRSLATLALILVAAGGAGTQTPARRLTTVAALYQFPSYFHLQNVMLHGEFVENGSQVVLRGGERDVPVMLTDAKSAGGLVEVRGQLLDIGRLEPGDPRVRAYMGSSEAERWPRPGEELVLSVTSVTEAQLATTPSVRALTLQPWRFEGQKVTVVGEFRGRNLFGDQPSAPGKSRYDFVLRSVDAAVWVTDLRPRGRGFDLSVEARVDTGRWLEVSGTVTQERGLVTISGTTVNTTTPPQEPAAEETSAPAPPPEPGEVVFSTPTESETDVALTRTVRVQFSRGLDAASLTDRIRVGYVGVVQPPAASEQPLQFTYSYDAATRAVEIRFSQPPERFRTIRVDVLEGVRTFDGAPVRPWMLTFSVGG